MLLIKRTVMLIVAGNAPAFFTGSGKEIPFSVDMFGFCRIFQVESNTTIKINIGHYVFFIIEVHNVIKRNNAFAILTTIWYRITLWTQIRMNYILCRIIKRDLDVIVVAHCFLQKDKLLNLQKVER